jgi:uncharacterized protein
VQTELFEWDDAKAALNVRLHGVHFEEAKTVFEDPFAIMIADEWHSEDELRTVTIGRSLLEKILLVVSTDRRDRIRIISARKATAAERMQYESGD